MAKIILISGNIMLNPPPPWKKNQKCSLNDFHTLFAILAKKIIYGALALATRLTRQKKCTKLSKNIKVKNSIVT